MSRSVDLARRIQLQFFGWEEVIGDPASPFLEHAPAPGKWSARENLAHCGRMHEIYLGRIGRILGEEGPALPAYRAESDPGWEDWRSLPAAEILERTRALRGRLASDVRGLSDRELSRTGVHGRLGPLTLSVWLEFFLAHEGHHLYLALKLARTAGVRE
jgi:hypothetical protein